MILSIDSNILIDAMRSPEPEAVVERLGDLFETLSLSSVVVAEIEAGARTSKARRLLEEGPLGVLMRESVIEAPTVGDWVRMGRLFSAHPEWARTASRQNDVLLAVQCVRLGWHLATRDRDFLEIGRHLAGLHLVPPQSLGTDSGDDD